MTRIAEDNCPIIEQTADGTNVGRCWFYLHPAVNYCCPRHGDVSIARQRYLVTGKLTLESVHTAEKRTNGEQS